MRNYRLWESVQEKGVNLYFPMRQFHPIHHLLVCLLFWGHLSAHSDVTMNYPYIHFGVDNGLPQSVITDIIQDSYGYIWLTTNEGIARFNGKHFTVFNEATGYPFRLVTGIVEIKPGVYWVATYANGLWQLQHHKATPITFAPNNPNINHITKTPDGSVLIVAEPGGVYEFKEGRLVTHIPDSGNGIHGVAITATKDKLGNYWVGTYQNGVQVFYHGQKIIHLTTRDGLPSNEIRSIYIGNHQIPFIGTYRGLFVPEYESFSKEFNQQFDSPFIANIFSQNGNDVWISLSSGKGGLVAVRNFKVQAFIQPQKGLFVRKVYIDRHNVLLLGTYQGLWVIPNRNFHNYGIDSGFLNPYIRAITATPQGQLYVGTRNDGLYRLQKDRFVRLDQFDPLFKEKSIFALAPVGKQLWVATSRGLYIIENNRLITNHPVTQFFEQRTVRRLTVHPDAIYVVTKDSLFTIPRGQPQPEIECINKNLMGAQYSFWGIDRDAKGQLCVATNGKGLFYLKQNEWRYVHSAFPYQKILALRKGPNGLIYLATSTGVYTWDGDSLHILLPLKYTVWDVLPTRHNGIWLLTSKGLQHYVNQQLYVYNHRNGLITTEFNMGAVFAENDSSYWFGGVNGLVHYKKEIHYPLTTPAFYITRVEAGDSTVVFPESKPLTFPYANNNVRIAFDWIQLGNTADVQLGYFLEGFDRDTFLVANQHHTKYTNLSAGKYRFHLFLLNTLTHQVIATRSVAFTILKPWWQTYWFRGLLALGFLGIVLLYAQWRTAVHMRRARLLEQMVEQRTRDIQQSKQLLEKEIEERRKIEASLDKERQLLSITLNAIADGVVTTTLDGHILWMNPAGEKLSGVPAKKAVNQPITQVFHLKNETDDSPIPLPEAIQQTDQQYLSARITNQATGKTKIVGIGWATVKDANQKEVGYVWIFRDITTERRLEEEIIKAQKLESIGLLAGGIAHDFNNILTGIMGNTQLAKLKLQMNDTNILPFLEGIEAATQNATRLTHQLLTFAKGGEPVKELISIKTILEENVEFSLRGTNVTCHMQIDENLWPVKADRGQISQVINNLVINAVQAMPGGGTLTITARNITKQDDFAESEALYDVEGEQFVKITVQDTGIGIPQENLARIFDPYFTTKQKGSGLGLATSYSIIKKHHGKLTVNSELGKGTCFAIYLPASPEGEQTSPKSKAMLFDGKGMRALIMDDEPAILDIVSNFLKIMGFEVETALNGEEALEKFHQARQNHRPFDVYIMDLTVRGGKGGVETAKEILATDPDAIIIVASGYTTSKALADYQQYGFAGRITKPFSLESFNKVLFDIFNRKMAY